MRTQYPCLTFKDGACCVNLGNAANEKWYPADRLNIVEWQVFRGEIEDPDFKKKMLDAAKRRPVENKNDILAKTLGPLGIKKRTTDWLEFYGTFGLTVEEEFLKLNARYFDPPKLVFSGNSEPRRMNEFGRRAGWQLTGMKFRDISHTGHLRLNIIRVGLPDQVDAKLKTFANELATELRKYSFTFVKDANINQICKIEGATEGNRQQLTTRLDAAYQRLGKPKFVLWWGDCHSGVPSICLTIETAKKKTKKGGTDFNILGNLSLKINFKLKGTNHNLKDAIGLKNEHTMTVGADVSHTGKGPNETYPSMAGVVATSKANSAQYLGSARLQKSNDEFISGLVDMMQERVKAYLSASNTPPKHILFYRDGVSESQYGMVKDKELPLIELGCRNAGVEAGNNKYNPPITLLIVGKRHHARFYPQNPGIELAGNLQPGLVVDTDVVTPDVSNFYLQSHDCALGIARSAHYIVITNGCGYRLDELEEITNKICYTGSRATKALSVCTPARYADLLCDRLRCYMQPALRRRPAGTSTSINDYRTDPQTWGANGGINPWNANLNDIMFNL